MANLSILFFAAVFMLVSSALATKVQQCSYPSHWKAKTNTDYSAQQLDERVKIATCDNASYMKPCKLEKYTSYPTTIAFSPKTDIETIETMLTVSNGIPLHYPGMYGQSACDNIYLPNGEKHGCPLKNGIEYVYKLDFPVEYMGRNLPLEVRWALKDKKSEQDQICFMMTINVSHKKFFGI